MFHRDQQRNRLVRYATAVLVAITLSGIAALPVAAQDATSQGGPSDEAMLAFNEGLDAAMEGDYEAAITAFTEAIEADPSFAEAYLQRAITHSDLGNYEEAIDDLNAAIENRPVPDPYDYYQRGYVYYLMGDYDAGIEDFTTAIEMDPDNGDVYFNRAFAFSAIENEVRRLEDCDAALDLWQESVQFLRAPDGGGRVEATLTQNGEQVMVAFEGTAGEAVTIQPDSPEETGLDLMMVVFDPGGWPIACNVDFNMPTRNTPIENLVLPETGIYRVLVGDVFNLYTGELTVSVEWPGREADGEAGATEEAADGPKPTPAPGQTTSSGGGKN